MADDQDQAGKAIEKHTYKQGCISNFKEEKRMKMNKQ